MKDRFFTRFKAIGLRQEGKSYAEIQEIVKLPRATIGYWLKNIRMPEKAACQIQERKAAAIVTARKTRWLRSEVTASGESKPTPR